MHHVRAHRTLGSIGIWSAFAEVPDSAIVLRRTIISDTYQKGDKQTNLLEALPLAWSFLSICRFAAGEWAALAER